MKKFYLLPIAMCASAFSFGQIQEVNVEIESPHLRSYNDNIAKTTACTPDTVQYALAKATALSTLNVNNSTSASEVGQYFDAPQPLTVSGLDFYAYKIDQTGGITLTATVNIYNASPVDSLPMGAPIATTTVAVDTSFGGGSLDTLRKSAVFSTPISINQPFIITVANNSAIEMGFVNSSYTAGDGQMEWLGMASIGGAWLHGYEINISGSSYDADALIEPYISYDLTASFSNDAGCLTGAQTVNFTDQSSAVLQNRMYNQAVFQSLTELSYTYNYGDGSPEENVISPSHAYAAAGPYDVTLTDTIYGWSGTCIADTVITIGSGLSVDYSLSNNGLQKTFTDISTSNQTISSWLWDFGDGNTSTMQNPSHTYASTGIYTVCLTVTDACGNDSTCHFVDASCADPASVFTSSDNYLDYTFSDASTSSQTITSWLWDFGDGNTSTQQNPSHTYASAGNYTVCLTVTDACGTDSTCQFITAVENTTGIISNVQKDLTLYPNPANNILNIETGVLPDQVNFITITGQKTRTITPTNNKISIDVSNWTKGIYFAQFVFVDGTTITRKIIVK